MNVHLHGRNAVYLCFHRQPWGKWLMSQPQRHCLWPSYATLQGSSIQSASVCHFPPPNNPCKGVGQAGWTLSALVAIDALVIRNNVWEWTPNTVYTYTSTARSGIRTHASPWDFNLNTVIFNFGDFNNSTHLPSSYNFISLYCML